MDTEVIKRVLDAYGLQWATIDEPQKGYRNESRRVILANGKAVNLMLFKSEPSIVARITRANRVSEQLAADGLATRTRFDPRIIRLQQGSRQKYAAIYNYLPGNTIPWEAYTTAHIKNLGQCLSAVHKSLQKMPKVADNVADEYIQIVGRMQRYFANPQVQAALQKKLGFTVDLRRLEHFLRVLNICQQLPQQQMLHMDFVRGNILFDDHAQITGILDFEKTAWGHPLFDIARTLAFLLVDCKYKTPRQVRKYFLQSGYARQQGRVFTTVRAGNLDLLTELTDLFLFYDFYKFLRHNPYESLGENEHYVRTLAHLVNEGLI